MEAGTLLGYQGNYSGDPANPVGIHLHFSIVKDDGQGKFMNETRMENTLDPSPYLGVKAGVFDDWSKPITCVKNGLEQLFEHQLSNFWSGTLLLFPLESQHGNLSGTHPRP